MPAASLNISRGALLLNVQRYAAVTMVMMDKDYDQSAV